MSFIRVNFIINVGGKRLFLHCSLQGSYGLMGYGEPGRSQNFNIKKKIKICEKLVLCDSGNEVNYFFVLSKSLVSIYSCICRICRFCLIKKILTHGNLTLTNEFVSIWASFFP